MHAVISRRLRFCPTPTVLLSLLTLVFQAALHPLVWLSSGLGLVIAPTAAFQQHKLTQVEALAVTNERLAAEVDQLTAENGRLQASVQQMEESVLNLQAMQETLSALQGLQGQSVEELERQLQESRDILARMQSNARGQLVQNLMTVLLRADADADMVLSDDDIDQMIQRLEGLHGINIDDQALRQVIIDNGRSVEAVMALARAAFATEDAAEHAIFKYVQEEEEGKE